MSGILYQVQSYAGATIPQDSSCPICLDPITAETEAAGHSTTTVQGQLESLHLFHAECLKGALQQKPECPICREVIWHLPHDRADLEELRTPIRQSTALLQSIKDEQRRYGHRETEYTARKCPHRAKACLMRNKTLASQQVLTELITTQRAYLILRAAYPDATWTGIPEGQKLFLLKTTRSNWTTLAQIARARLGRDDDASVQLYIRGLIEYGSKRAVQEDLAADAVGEPLLPPEQPASTPNEEGAAAAP